MGGKSWGNLAYIRNIVYVTISPYEQKLFKNYLAKSWMGFRRDWNSNAPYFVPGLLVCYLTIQWGKSYNEKWSRKNPADFENEVFND